jgi:hypothetical protein
MKRSLTLRRETLTELATAELANVAGANAVRLPTLPLSDCLFQTARCTQTQMPACMPGQQ